MDEGFVEGGGDISIGKVYSIFSASIYIRKRNKLFVGTILIKNGTISMKVGTIAVR